MSARDATPFDRRRLSKALSAIAATSVAQMLARTEHDPPRRARVIGVTGPPGAGKSTLIGRLAALRLERLNSIAVLAIDPTSPLTRGSILGDRIRMDALAEDPRVFIRSLPSRSAEDGLTENLAEMIAVLDDFGFEEVIVETVGVGQTAYGVRVIADVELLVLTPNGGDYVQAMKAGIMETADVFVVNKADLPGAERFATELLAAARHGREGAPREIVSTRSGEADGVRRLSAAIDAEITRGRSPGVEQRRARARRRYRAQSLILRRLAEVLEAQPPTLWDAPLARAYETLVAALAVRLGVNT